MEKAASPPAVSIPIKQAEQLIALYRNIEAADAHFKRCQNELFRRHMQSVYKTPMAAGAFCQLKEQIDAAKARPIHTEKKRSLAGRFFAHITFHFSLSTF